MDGTRSVVGSIALAIVRDAELARDVAQEVFLAAWRDLGSLRDPHSLLPWLRQMTRHRAYHVLRTERRRARRVTTQDTEQLMAMALYPLPHAGAAMLADEERRLFEAVFDELPDAAREVVTLYYREGESTAPCRRTSWASPRRTSASASTRARTKLRGSLLERFGSAARRTAPDATLTTAVLTALAVGTPSLSSAATLQTASSAAASGLVPSLVAKLAAIGGGAMLGAAGGIAGVLFGTRQLKRQARFAEELHALRRFEKTSVGLVLVAAAMFPISWQLTHQALVAGRDVRGVPRRPGWPPPPLAAAHPARPQGARGRAGSRPSGPGANPRAPDGGARLDAGHPLRHRGSGRRPAARRQLSRTGPGAPA